MTLLLELPKDCLNSIFNYLDSNSLWQCRAVNKHFKSISDAKIFVGYQEYYPEMLKPLHKNLQEIYVTRLALSRQEKALKSLKLNIMERVFSAINHRFPSLHLLDLLNSLFPSPSLNQQLKLEQDLVDLNREIGLFLRDQELAKSGFLNKKLDLNSLRTVHDLFGGLEAYLKLPVLTLNDYGDYISSIKVKNLTAPIMRGRDRYARNFFVLRVIHQNQKQNYLLFAQRYMNNYTVWTTHEIKDPAIHDYIIKDSSEVFNFTYGYLHNNHTIEEFSQIKTLIQTGKLRSWTLF